MTKCFAHMFFLTLVLLMTSPLVAQPTVTFVPAQNSNGSSSGNYSVQLVSGKYDIVINKTYTDLISPLVINISAPISLPNPVRQIDIDFGSYVTSTDVNVQGSSAIFRSISVDRIWGTGLGTLNAELFVFMDGDLGADLLPTEAAVDGFAQVNLDIKGSVFSDVYSTGTGQISTYTIEGDVEGDLVALNGKHKDIQILESAPDVGGNLKGNVIALNGRIESLVVEGDIGETGDPVIISADTEIWYVDVPNGDVYADFSAVNILNINNTDEGVFINGDMKESSITLSNSFREDFKIIGGDFAATSVIDALHLADGKLFKIERVSGVGGSMLGEMHFSGVLGGGNVLEIDHELAGLLTFGGNSVGSLHDDMFIFGDPAGGAGLTGQVVLNSDGTADEPWGVGVVHIGPSSSAITLSPTPYYDNKSSTFGGGAVGLVPYSVHLKDCTPVGTKDDDNADGIDDLEVCEDGYHALKKVAPGGQVSSVTLKHYGRILQAGTGKPFRVWHKSLAGVGCVWVQITDQIGGPFTHTLHPGGDERSIQINGPFVAGYDYRIEPRVDTGTSDYLYCDDISSTVGLYDYDYRLRVVELQDLTQNGLIQPDDITAWIANPEDTTLDGVTDTFDLIDVTEAVVNGGD